MTRVPAFGACARLLRIWSFALLGALASSAFALPAHAQGASVLSASAAQKKQAAKEYTAGMKAFEDKKFEEALDAFERSYDIVKSPNSQLMIARALAELKRYGQAWDALKDAEREAQSVASKDDKYKQTLDAVRTELKDMERKAGFVNVSVSGAGEEDHVVVEGKALSVDQLGEAAAVTPGKVHVALVSGGKEVATKDIDVAAGATVDVSLSPPAEKPQTISDEDTKLAEEKPPPQKVEVSTSSSSGMRTLAFVAAGVGVAGLATFGVFGLLNNSKFSDLEDACGPNKVCAADQKDTADTGRTYQTIANIGLVVGVVGVAGGVTLFVLSGNKSEASPAETAELRVGPGSVSVHGRF